MNKATISIAVFIIIFVGGLLFWRAGTLQAPAPDPDTPAAEDSVPVGGFAPMVSEEALATHNTGEDCWVSYNGSVYDITDWVGKHPGGMDAIISVCGESEKFEETLNAQHGAGRADMLPDVGVFIGTLGVIEGAQS
jgi:predicted heme/steroid binding protein